MCITVVTCSTLNCRRLQGDFCQHHLGVSDLRFNHRGQYCGLCDFHVFFLCDLVCFAKDKRGEIQVHL